MSDVVVLTAHLLCTSSSMRASRPHTSSGPHPSEHPPTRRTRRHALPTRPSTSSGVPDPTDHLVPIVVTSPFAGVSPVPVRFYLVQYVIRRPADHVRFKPFADFMSTRRRSAKKRKEGAPPSRPHAVATTTARPDRDLPKRDAHFSTADRAILEELKLGAAARESQFKMKASKKHHPYPAKEAPYPLNFERPVIDQFVLSISAPTYSQSFFPVAMSGRQCSSSNSPQVRLFMSLTFRPQKCKSLPTSLSQTFTHRRLRLDLGCGESTLATHFFFCPLPYPAGSGYWILECAKQWRVSCPSTLTEADAQSSPELRVRR